MGFMLHQPKVSKVFGSDSQINSEARNCLLTTFKFAVMFGSLLHRLWITLTAIAFLFLLYYFFIMALFYLGKSFLDFRAWRETFL